MANQLWEVITLVDSDDASESKVETTPIVKNNVKSDRTTARKSVKSGRTVTTLKQEPRETVSQPSVLNKRSADQMTSSKTTENSAPPHKTARKSFKTSNVPTETEWVTSPKLSLKRKRILETLNSQEKKLKVDSQNTKIIPLPYIKTISGTSTNSVPHVDLNNAIPLPYFQSTNGISIDPAPPVDSNKAIPLSHVQSTNSTSTAAARPIDTHRTIPLQCAQSTSSTPSQHPAEKNDVSENTVPWSSTDDNARKFKKLLEFSKAFMTATAAEKCTIVKNFHKLLAKANPNYVNSKEFDLLLNETLKKIKESKDTFVQLQTIKTELKAYKQKRELDTSLNSNCRSSSSERSETTKYSSKLGTTSPSVPQKKETKPIQPEHNCETTKFASKLGLAPSKPQREEPIRQEHLHSTNSETTKFASNVGPSKLQKEVPEPIQLENLASAIRSAQSNLKSHKGSNISNPLSNIPSTSQQADFVENIQLSMPVNDITTPANDLRNIPPTSMQACSIDRFCYPLPVIINTTSACDLEIMHTMQEDVVSEDCNRRINDKTSGNDLENKPSAPYQANERSQTPLLNNQSALSRNDALPKQNEPLLVKRDALLERDQLSRYREDPFLSRIGDKVKLEDKSLNLSKAKPAASSKNPQSKDDKIEKRVKFLEDFLAKLDKKIKKLQCKELSLDEMDDEDSTYILEDRYKKKFQKAWTTLCRIKKRSHLVGREIDRRFTYQGSRHDTINKAIEKLINKRKVTEKFPNYVEVFNLIQKINTDIQLSLSSYGVEREAKDAFENIGAELKRRRQTDEERDFGCYLTDNLHLETDPADVDEELNKKLSSSVVEGEKKIKEIIDKYAAEQREKAPGEESGEEEGSDCEEETHNDELSEENPQVDPPGEENPVDMNDLPDTDPATPETDERIDSPEIVVNSVSSVQAPVADVIDIGSSSDASTDPGTSVEPTRNTAFIPSERIFINDEIEIIDNQDSSPELPTIAELCK